MSYYLDNDGKRYGRVDKPLPETVRHRYDEACWSVTTPLDKWYGTALIYAQEFFDGARWRPIEEARSYLQAETTASSSPT